MNTIKLSNYGVTITNANIGKVNEQVDLHPVNEPLILDFDGIRGIDSKVANELLTSLHSRQGGQVFIKNTEPMVKSVLIFSGQNETMSVATDAPIRKSASRHFALFGRLFSLLLLFALSFGFNQEAKADINYAGKVYFDNSTSNLSGKVIQICGRQNSYTGVTTLNNIGNTKLYYAGSLEGSSWGGILGWFVIANSSSWSNGNFSETDGNLYWATSWQTYGFDSGNYYLIKATATGSGRGKSVNTSYLKNGYSDLNKTQTIKVMVKKAGASSYTETTYSSWPATIKAKRYKLNSANSADVTDANLTSATFTSVITSAAKIYVPTPNTGYTFKGWGTSSSSTPSNASSAYEYTVEDTKTIYLFFDENTYNITATANPLAGGTVTPTTATAMGQISGGDITATNNTGYHFVNWEVGTATGTFGSSTTASTTFKPTKAGTVVANFAENTHNITISNDGNGSTTPSGAQSNVGEVTGIQITATPNDDYGFKEWVVSGGTISAQSATTTFKPTADNATIQATFQSTAVYYTWGFGVYQSTGGTVGSTVAAGDHVQGGTSITLTASPATGYEVDGWYDNQACSGQALQVGQNTYSFTISANSVRYVKFKKTNYAITYTTQSTGWTYGGSNPTTANYGDQVSFVVNQTAGYTVSVTSSDVTLDASAAPTYKFTMPAKAVAISVSATENMTSVTVSSSNTTWGTVSPASANVGVATSKTVTATPKSGYKFVSWTLTNAVLSSGSLTNAQITIKGDGSSATGTAVATFAEDLSSNWYVEGDDALFPEGRNANNNSMMKHTAPNSKSLTWTLTVAEADISKSAGFKIYQKVSGSSGNWWGYGGGDTYWDIYDTDQNGLHHGDNAHNIYFHPSIAGEYTFTIDDITKDYPTLTVTWPIYNCVYGEFNSWSMDDNKLEFNGSNTASTVVNIPDVTKSYEFLVLVNSNYLTNNASYTTPITRSTASDVTFASKGQSDNNAKFTPDIAGNYTFTYNKSTNKLTITYPALPTASTSATEKRIFNENVLSFIGGEGTDANPYQIYTDEALTIDIAALAAQTNLTAKYQFGEDAATTDVLTKTIINPSIEKTSILIKAFYESDGVAGTAWEKTIWYQGIPTPTLYLTTSWSNDEAQKGSDVPDNVTIYYSTANYSGSATVTRSKDGAEEETFFEVPNGTTQKDQTYTLPNKEVQRQTFVATATANGRTFTATKAVSIYRLVEITITDEDHLMDHYYMWEAGTTPVHEEAAWPGNIFFSTLGDAHIFYVKYPSYTHFVLNNGKASTEDDAAQTIDVAVPNQSTCYTIGSAIASGDDQGKYAVQVADECPNKLYVGDIPTVSAVQGEGVIVSPQVDIDPLLNENDLTISFNYGSTQGITCDQRGRSFMVTATAGTGTYNIQVTYSIPGATNVTKDVTIKVTSAIMIQAKIGNLGWNDSGNHDNVWLHYWMNNGTTGDILMSWKDYVDNKDRYYARIPLGNDGNVNFMIGYPNNGEYWGENWRMSNDVTNVTASGCYTISDGGEGQKRAINRDGNNCWTLYYVEIDMANGSVYRSNTVEDLTKQVSFFAPSSSEPQAKSGAVRIICNGSQTVVVSAATFDSSTVYTAKITANGAGLEEVAYYTGDYYIRTDAAEGGWNDYVKDSHKFTYFTPYKDALYDYYWVMNKKVNNQGDQLNIKGCVGNGINENLANMIESDNYTDGYGNITPDAETGVNLRFGYNPNTNYFERSILRGSTAGSNDFLNLVGNNVYNDKSCQNELNETNYDANPSWSKFGDISNWVYEKNVYVKIDGSHPSAQALLKSKAFNGTTIYQLGYTLDDFGRQTGTPAQRYILGSGTTNGTYNIRVTYDFKTNRIVSAWSPIEDVTYSTETKIEADVLFVRHEDTPVAQVKLDNNAALVSELNSAYFVMEIDGSSDKSSESIYWFSVPFDCEINSIFGVEGYVTLTDDGIPTAGTWGIQEYDGKTRAQKGWYIQDTQTFWRWMRKNETLKKGHGYVLVFDRADANTKDLWKTISREEPCEGTDDDCRDGKKTVTTTVLRLYFPSSESGWKMTRSGESEEVEYPDWTCTKPNRKAQDSNWRLLGTDSYSDIMITKQAQFHRLDDDSVVTKAPNFVYVYDRSQPPYNRYASVTSVGKNFQSFNCYMVQFSGTINWNQYTQSEHDGTSVAARRVVAENELTNAQMTLSLKKGNNTEDNTYIYMDARATTDFDNQMDLTKITDTRANHIYSVINEVEYAGNTLPVEDQIVPLTVNINANGAYTFAMPEMTDGLEVYLMDNATNAHIDMAIDSYTVDLNKGKIADRFYLDVRVKERTTPTIIETIGSDGNPTGDRFIKVIQNDQLHIIRNGRIYNASGMKLTK